MHQAGIFKMPAYKILHSVSQLIIQAQMKKKRLCCKRLMAMMNDIFNEIHLSMVNSSNGAGIQKQARAQVQGDGIAIQIKSPQKVFQGALCLCLPESN